MRLARLLKGSSHSTALTQDSFRFLTKKPSGQRVSCLKAEGDQSGLEIEFLFPQTMQVAVLIHIDSAVLAGYIENRNGFFTGFQTLLVNLSLIHI